MTVVWTLRALRELEAIVAFIARDKPVAARRTAERVHAAAGSLATFPLRGRVLLGKDRRELILAPLPYILRYSVEEDGVILITSVRHGAMRDASRAI